MNEPTLIDRATMLLKTLVSIVGWVVALFATLVRGKLKGSANEF